MRVLHPALPLAFAGALFLTFSVQAQEPNETAVEQQSEPLRLEESVVVTADRLREEVDLVGSSVTVITAEQIRRSGAQWLADVLMWAPGVTVARTGGPGAATSPGRVPSSPRLSCRRLHRGESRLWEPRHHVRGTWP